ncbi:MAG: hypothetical protein JWQ77_3829 [Jatrophihabitans sp.]|nr:hypothetical protein [Jatrophihabitans sp.]
MATRAELAEQGFTASQLRAQLAAHRWHRVGRAIVLHNATPTTAQLHRICLLNCGPHAVLTSFTAAQEWGLRGWDRAEVHVLAPRTVTRPPIPGLRLHQVGRWGSAEVVAGRRLHALAPSLVVAASSFERVRSACGIFAAAVQQRLLRPAELRAALSAAPRTRHRAALLRVVGDIEQGADALTEIDFVRLCRRYGLPRPTQQAVRVTRGGRRRYLDAEWCLADGRIVAVEVDGAHHIAASQWSADQLRQNEIVLGGTLVLRFPAVVVREEPWVVAEQLRRALGPSDLPAVRPS